MRPSSLTLALAAIVSGLAPLRAQEGQRPAGWQVRFDDSTALASSLKFAAMSPGWHITTGSAAIVYEPSRTAEGAYLLRSGIFVFPESQADGFGVFLGGRRLTEPDAAYTYFVIRKDGRFLVGQRRGRKTQVLIPWTAHAAIVTLGAGKRPVENTLAVDAGAERVAFLVNGKRVATLPRARVQPDGVVGLHVGDALNLHVTELAVEKRESKE